MDMMPDIPAPREALQLALKRYVGPKPNIDALVGNNDDESKDLGPVIVMVSMSIPRTISSIY